jgi:alkanesulfonate monooxygenase SsuD/methylene tetrahydromethanopterin reductase-like flavin-dependent oxidoreductase (luciferase family)
VRLLSHVYVPAYRHPLQVAKAFATLDVVSGGRVILGVGAGHVEAEFDVLGVPFAERGKLLDESIDALRAAFAEDYPTLPGPRWPAADLGQHPRPVQEDGPPIWVGGSSKPAIRRAAERGDGWLPQGPVTPEIVARIHELREAAGRHEPFDLGALIGATYVGDPDPDWDLGGPVLSGSPDKLAHVLRKFAGMGVGQVQIRLRSRSADELVDQIGRFGREVLPQLVLD